MDIAIFRQVPFVWEDTVWDLTELPLGKLESLRSMLNNFASTPIGVTASRVLLDISQVLGNYLVSELEGFFHTLIDKLDKVKHRTQD